MKNFMIYLSILMISNIYAQCDDYILNQCNNDNSCEWVEDIEYGHCEDIINSYDCGLFEGCSWWSGCNGGSYEIDNSYCQEIEMPECNEENEFQCTDGLCIPIHRVCNNFNDCLDGSDEIDCENCSELLESDCSNDDSCEWIEDIEIGNCSVFDNSESSCTSYSGECYWDEDITYGSCNGYDNNQWACNNAQGCYWDCYYGYCGCNGQEITGVDTECIGQYEIDNSYCEEIVMPECSEMNETECSSDDSCDWVEDIEWGNCDNYNSSASCHNAHEDCWWDLCYGGYYGQWSHCCRGGSFQIDNSYCEEVEYQLGDINGDYIINVLDIIEVINLVLDNEYNYIVDMNNDLDVNVLDIIELVNIILNGEGF